MMSPSFPEKTDLCGSPSQEEYQKPTVIIQNDSGWKTASQLQTDFMPVNTNLR